MPQVSHAAAQLRQGLPILLVDDLSKPNTSYLVLPAISATEDDVAFLVNNGRGNICVALPEERVQELGLSLSAARGAHIALDFTVSVEARQGVTTGISAADRALTLRTIAKTSDPKQDLVMPGHMFPVRALTGGVLVRAGVAEASVDLLRIAEVIPAAALCPCLTSEGELLSEAGAKQLSESQSLPMVSISEIIRYQLATQTVVSLVSEASIPVRALGDFRALCFISKTDNAEHLALVIGDVQGKEPVLVRVQAENRLGDLVGTTTLNQRSTMHGALRAIHATGRGVFVYIRHPRQHSILEHLEAANQPAPSKPDEVRRLGIGAQILRSLGVEKIRLLTNSTRDIAAASAFKLDIVERVPFALTSAV